MTHTTFRIAAFTTILAATISASAQAQQLVSRRAPALLPGNGLASQPVSHPSYGQGTIPVPRRVPRLVRNGAVHHAIASQRPTPGYPYLNAPLYASPRPDIPYQMGGAVITNQAFAPHEMLYKHDYRAMYPPFYYRSHGGWVVTPHGVRSKEHWTLQGTDVRVKYRTRIPFLIGYEGAAIR